MTFALCFGQVANICTPTQADSSQRNPVPIEPMETFCKWVTDVLRFRTTLMPTIHRLPLGLPHFFYLDPFTQAMTFIL